MASLSQMYSRDAIGSVLNQFDLTGSLAEIGVLSGSFTKIVLKDWKGKAYWCVDAWERQPEDIYRERTSDVDYQKCYEEVQALADKDKRVIVLKGKSPQIALAVPNNSLDMVFIDANHSYQAVIEDMDAWFPKVKKGGVFAGHDYYHSTKYPDFCEVSLAVNDWMDAHSLDFVTDKSEPRSKSWWSVKP